MIISIPTAASSADTTLEFQEKPARIILTGPQPIKKELVDALAIQGATIDWMADILMVCAFIAE